MIIDISREISEDMTLYKDREENKPKISKSSSVKSEGSNTTKLVLNSHLGTHIDAPYHVSEEGKKIDELSLDKFYGNCRVFDLTSLDEKISKKDLEKLQINEGDIVLFKTKNSFKEKFDFKFIYLDKTGAEYLVSKGVKTVGIDELGIERDQPEHETHNFLLKAGIPIIEGLNLKDVEQEEYTLCCFPLKLNIDGSPARAVLLK
ncbi:MAG: cyclase family protein [Candidatus Undinarchaeales archaeon]